MSREDIELLAATIGMILFLAAVIALHQKTRGYSYLKSFIRSVIALSALAALILKLFFF